MPTKFWIKLHLELLDDPKMGQMPDWLWRRTIELFLAAGENGDDGVLQPVPQLAWRLRLPDQKLVDALQALSAVGVVREIEPGIWQVKNFEKRQAAATSTERVQQFRKRQSKGGGNDNETNRFNNETSVSSLSISSSYSSSDLNSSLNEEEGEEEPEPSSGSYGPELELFKRITGRYPYAGDWDMVTQNVIAARKRLKSPPVDIMDQEAKDAFETWCRTPRSDGRGLYNPSNAHWTDWLATGFRPVIGSAAAVDPLEEAWAKLEAEERNGKSH